MKLESNKFKGESFGSVLKWTVTNSPPLNQNKFKLKIQGINAVCDPQFPDFYKIKSKTFTFCTSPTPHACPVQLIPKVSKAMSEKLSFYFHFLLKFKPKY